MDSKRYTILPKQTIDTWVESIGVNKIPEEVSEILSEDATYRIRELVHVSAFLFQNQISQGLLFNLLPL